MLEDHSAAEVDLWYFSSSDPRLREEAHKLAVLVVSLEVHRSLEGHRIAEVACRVEEVGHRSEVKSTEVVDRIVEVAHRVEEVHT